GERIGAQFGGGEADAVDGDAGAEGSVTENGGAADGEARSSGDYGSEFLNNSGEHPGILRPRTRPAGWGVWRCYVYEWRPTGGAVRCRRRGGELPCRPGSWGRSRRKCDPQRRFPARSS